MTNRSAERSNGRVDDVEALRRRWAYGVRQRCAAIVRASGMTRPPFFPERYAARCGVSAIVAAVTEGEPVRFEHRSDDAGRTSRAFILVDRRLPPHTPQWNGAVALGLGETLVPQSAHGEIRRALVETGAAELLLPMAVFRPAAARTDLTVDGLRDLAARFAAPLRLTARQWLTSGLWHGFALLWREEGGTLRLWWRAASPGTRAAPALGADAAAVWTPGSRLFLTHRTGRAHHGVEEVRSAGGTAWWFVRFAGVRDPADAADRAAARAVLAMVLLARRGRRAEGIVPGSSN